MKNIVIALLLTVTMGFCADTNWQKTNVAGKSTRTIPMALGAAVTIIPSNGIVTANLVITATTGRGDLPQIIKISSAGNAITTVNAMTLTNMAVGDVIYIQSALASEDVVVVEDDSTIYLGGETRTLSDPADILIIQKFSSTAVREVGFVDNN